MSQPPQPQAFLMDLTKNVLRDTAATMGESIPISWRKPKSFDKLARLLVEHGVSDDAAEGMLFDAILDRNNELEIKSALPDFVKEIQWDGLDDIKHAMNLYMEFSNDTPLWLNKGHTPAELCREASKRSPYIGKPQFIGVGADKLSAAWDQMIRDAPKRDAPGAVVPFLPADRQRQQAAVTAPKKVGRNDLCPCGSGKKYKHCCGRSA